MKQAQTGNGFNNNNNSNNLAFKNMSDIEAVKFKKKTVVVDKPKAKSSHISFAEDEATDQEHAADTSSQLQKTLNAPPPFFNMFWNELLQSNNNLQQHSATDSASKATPAMAANQDDLASSLEAYFSSGQAFLSQPAFDINSILKIYQLQLQKNLAASFLNSKLAECAANQAMSSMTSQQVDLDQSMARSEQVQSRPQAAKRPKKKPTNQF